ncbi:hypothetical protein EDD96_0155 [Streptomyces sp. Ag109_G2-6]|uniref:hypothetical protein n=1 Tax=Streptomyces TaxID=1883 RepID=UPI0009A53167|nr:MULTISPECIES: hypothetical protein [Streptomyces]RPF43653.1 hypothetical protein EDD96_0155 [Streptomyces sp. Ag109_G2-6]
MKFEGHTPVCAPSLAQFQDWVWLTEIGADRRPYLNLTDGTRWRDVLEDNLKWTVDNPVAMAPHGGYLWRTTRGTDAKVYSSATAGGGENWDSHGAITGWGTSHGPALAAHDRKLWIFLRTGDGALNAASHTIGWSALHHVGPLGAARPMDEPTAASNDNKLYVMYRR